MASSDADETVRVQFQSLSGTAIKPQVFRRSDPVYALSQHVKKVTEMPGPGLPSLIWQGKVLPQGASSEEAGLTSGCVVQVVWLTLEPPRRYCRDHTDELPARALPDPTSLQEDLARGRLDLSGVRGLDKDIVIPLLSPSLTSLDLRQCRLRSADVAAIFEALPAGIKELRASRNHISGRALQVLQDKALRLSVLDIGYSECVVFSHLAALVGEHTEELGLADLEDLTGQVVSSLLPRFTNLRKISLEFCIGRRGLDFGAPVLEALSEHCPDLEVVEAHRCDCSSDSIVALVTKCPQIRVLSLSDEGVDESAVAAIARLQRLDKLHLEVGSAKALLAAARLSVSWLHLAALQYYEDGEEAWCGEVGGVESMAGCLAEALRHSTSSAIGLEVPCLSGEVLRAVGPRLRSLGASDWSQPEEGQSAPSLLSALLGVPESCENLCNLSIHYWEQIEPGVLAAVAAACPNLERLWLNADDMGFQKAPIDEGVLALGRSCPQLVHLDLYDRCMDDAAAVLAKACEGWPRLQYLCASNTSKLDWKGADPECILPCALAAHCVNLRELDIADAAALESWRDILQEGCPLLQLAAEEDEDEEDEDEQAED